MYKIFSFSLPMLFLITLTAQTVTDSNVNGHVIGLSDRKHIPHVNIVVKGTAIGTATDISGHYFLKNIPVGKYTLVASILGYKSKEVEISCETGKTIEVNIELEEDVVLLNSVVVSANRNETDRKEAPVIVSVISPKMLENTNSVCLAQGLNYQPGLRVESNCQNCGFQQVRINGLDGPYSQILIDSRPVFSSLAGVYGIEQIPANMIERVEIVRGGGSALFGSNAIAGTINIITKEPISNSVVLSNTTNLIKGRAADINTSLNASIVSENYQSGIMLFGSSRQRSPYDDDGDGFTEIGKIEAKTIGFRAFFKLNEFNKLGFEYHNLGEFRRGGNQLNLPAHESDITEQTVHNINTGGLRFDHFSKNLKQRVNMYTSAQWINRTSYYGTQRDPNAYGFTNDKTAVAGVQYSRSIDTLWFMPAELTVGAEYSSNAMKDIMLGYHRTINQSVYTTGFFAQNEWKNKKTGLLAGLRLDKHNLIKNPVISPRFNFRLNLREDIGFRLSYATGFRAPQAFDEDLHVTAVGGNVALIHLNPDLKTEKSESYSASADIYRRFGKMEFNFLIEGFYTPLNNVFVLKEMGVDTDGNLILERCNGSGAVVQGINFEGKAIPGKKWQFQFGFTLQKSEYKEALNWSSSLDLKAQKRMFRSPSRYGYLTLNIKPLRDFSLSFSGTYTGPMLVQHFSGYIESDREEITPDFFDLNLKMIFDFKLKSKTTLQLNMGIQNLFNSYQRDFDKGEFRDAGYMYGPSFPRSVFAGLKINM